MQCNRCHGAMMAETVIKLRPGLFGFRETRSQGAYCASCQIGVVVEPPAPAPHRQAAIASQPAQRMMRLLPAWRPMRGTRSDFVEHATADLDSHLSMAR